jgi:putative glutamine amidotransferase
MKLPLIAIMGGMSEMPDNGPPAYALRRNYVDAIVAAGGVPLLVPPLADEPLLMALYEHADALLLSGGEDIEPTRYGEPPHSALQQISPARDAAELLLTRRALAEGKPLLGICRGIQVLNVACGGTLYQDIPAQYPTTIDHNASKQHPEWSLLAHDLHLEPDSQLAELLGTTSLMTNSLHHQAVKDVGAGLRAVGHAPDGLIEALEGTNGSFVLGVQCHPEVLRAVVEPRWQTIFGALIRSVR